MALAPNNQAIKPKQKWVDLKTSSVAAISFIKDNHAVLNSIDASVRSVAVDIFRTALNDAINDKLVNGDVVFEDMFFTQIQNTEDDKSKHHLFIYLTPSQILSVSKFYQIIHDQFDPDDSVCLYTWALNEALKDYNDIDGSWWRVRFSLTRSGKINEIALSSTVSLSDAQKYVEQGAPNEG